jgi:D-glycero-alpha-D-manno-heptose 1-phosphate guanylyltransferase
MPPKHDVTSAIILAGGLGMRLRGAVPELPKPMAPIRGKPFLEYQMAYWQHQGIDRFMLAVGYRHEAIINHFGNNFNGARIEYSIENTPLGTGGSFIKAARQLAPVTPFLLLNGDTYFEVDLGKLDAFATSRSSQWCFSVFRDSAGERYDGISMMPDGRMTSFRTTNSSLLNGGIYWIHPQVLEKIATSDDKPVSLEMEILPSIQSSGLRMHALECSGDFIDIGTPADFQRAQQLLPDLSTRKGLT